MTLVTVRLPAVRTLRGRLATALGFLRSVLRPQSLADGLVRRVAVNSGWLIAERLLRMVAAVLISIWIVRHLGPHDFGILAYGLSLVLLVDTVAALGLKGVVVREVLEDPRQEPEIVGTTVGLRLGMSLVALLGVLGWGVAARSDSAALGVVTVLTLGLPLGSLSVLELAFESSLQSRHGVMARVVALALASVLRIVLLAVEAPLMAFAVAGAFELTVAGLICGLIYHRVRGSLLKLRFRGATAMRLLRLSWPLLVSSVAMTVYLKIDQVMLQHLVGSTEVGVYAAAARLSEIWYFLPVALATSLLPLLVAQRQEGQQQYRRSLQRAFDVSVWVAIALAAATTLIAAPLIGVLYGAPYTRTADILRVHMWAAPFVFMGTIFGRAMIAEHRLNVELLRHSVGAAVNIGLNVILIPRYGGVGAAVATLVSYSIVSYFICFLLPSTRPHARAMTRAFAWPLRGVLARRLRARGHPAPPPEVSVGPDHPRAVRLHQPGGARHPGTRLGTTHRPHHAPEGDGVREE